MYAADDPNGLANLLTAPQREPGSAIAIVSGAVAFLTANGVAAVSLDNVPVAPLSIGGTTFISLASDGTQLVIGGQGATAVNQGVFSARLAGGSFVEDPTQRQLSFRAPPTALAVGFTSTQMLVAAGAPDDSACFSNSGGIVLLRSTNARNTNFAFSSIHDAYGPEPVGRFGALLALADGHLASRSGELVQVLHEVNGRLVIHKRVRLDADALAIVSQQLVLVEKSSGSVRVVPLDP